MAGKGELPWETVSVRDHRCRMIFHAFLHISDGQQLRGSTNVDSIYLRREMTKYTPSRSSTKFNYALPPS